MLEILVPEPEVAVLAGRYLKIMLVGAPGFAAFESGKRFMQAQGLFDTSLWILLICAPANAFLNWLLVWVWHKYPRLSCSFRLLSIFSWRTETRMGIHRSSNSHRHNYEYFAVVALPVRAAY